MLLKWYVGLVVLGAAVTGALAGFDIPAPHSQTVVAVVPLALLILLAERLQVRHFRDGGHVDALNLMEGILAPLVLFTSGATVAITVVAAIALADPIGSRSRLKAVFNVSQWLLAASAASLVAHAAGRDVGDKGVSVAMVVLVVVTMSAINQIAVTTVLTIATHRTADRQGYLHGLIGRLISNSAALVTGVCLVALYAWHPWLVLTGAFVLLGLDATARANASLRADRRRLEGLHRASNALAVSIEGPTALPVFLAEVRAGFEVSAVELVLFASDGVTVHRCSGPDAYAVSHEEHVLAGLLAGLADPVRLSADRSDSDVRAALVASGHSRALAIPLRASGSDVGLLLYFDRIGVEGFENGEVAVAEVMGRELVGFLERVALVQAIDEERRKMADILESTSDGILTIEPDGTVTSWNAGLAAITGYPSDDMVGTRHFGLLRPRDAKGRDILVERWSDDATALPAELQIVTRDGATVWLSCSYSRIPAAENHADLLVIVARNVTQMRELERLKDDFVAVVSHELRTPLVPIKGWAQTLLNRGDRLSDDQRRTAVQSILAQAQKLESLVLNILEASRIEAGRADDEGPADVTAVVMRIIEDMLSARPDRTIRMRPPTVPCQVKGSAVWVDRAVTNLLANAIKYSADDEPVDVDITVDADNILVSVTDRGPGIPGDAHDRIFERFERLEEARTQTGTGLGLYITRRLARAMGGDVTVTSVPGAGSTFVLRLPAVAVTRLPEQRGTRQGDKAIRLHG